MKRTLVFLLIVVVVAGLLGTMAEKDPGYVLISYDGATLQTGLWVFLGALALFGFLVWFGAKIWRWVFGSAARIQSWRKDRVLSKSIEHTNKGLLLLHEGNAERAIKFLTSGVKHQPQPAINYLHLAQAANDLGKAEDQEKYLRLALDLDASAKPAIAMVTAELAYERGDFSGALNALDAVSKTNRALILKKNVLLASKQWDQLSSLLAQLKKIMSFSDFERLEKIVVLAGLSDPLASDDKLLSYYRSASEGVRTDTEVLLKLCQCAVDAEKEVESIARKAIKVSWQPQLVEAYAKLGKVTLHKRLKTAIGWQKAHPLDASLSFCIGHLQELAGDKVSARSAYEAAVEQGGHRLAGRQLANLHAFDGDHQKSNEYLNIAYRD